MQHGAAGVLGLQILLGLECGKGIGSVRDGKLRGIRVIRFFFAASVQDV